MNALRAVVTFGLVSLLLGCASSPRAQSPAEAAPAPPETVVAPLVLGDSGREVSMSEVASRAAHADVVVIGELHGHPVGLPTAAALFEEIVRMSPRTALGLEFYERDDQVHLDDYLAGVTDEDAFREAVGKAAESDSHRSLIETARENDLRVWALNAPRRYVRLARTDGFGAYDEMTAEQRRLVTVPESLTQGRYAETFYDLMGDMGGHGEESAEAGPSEMAVSFFRSQNVWDATMAGTAVRALDAGARPLVIIVGRFHTDFEGGLVERLRERAPGARVLTVSTLDAEAADIEDADAGRADVLMLAGPMPQAN